MKKIYVGSFPGERGGVTIKNEIIFNELFLYDREIIKINVSKSFSSLKEIIRTLRIFFSISRKIFIVGLSSKNRNRFTKILYYLKRKSLSNSILIVMGGDFSENVRLSKSEKMYNRYKKIYVETPKEYNNLKEFGFTNVSIFPNPKSVPKVFLDNQELLVKDKEFSNRPLKFVYFSKISKMKGVDLIFEALKDLPESVLRNIYVDIYGVIEEKDSSYFFNEISLAKNVSYEGSFSGNTEEIVEVLSKYDLLLFPSKWKTEGVPGVLVEAKFAGLPSLVFNLSNNNYLVQDKVNGLLLEHVDITLISDALVRLEGDRLFLKELSLNSFRDSENYRLENYIDDLRKEIFNEK